MAAIFVPRIIQTVIDNEMCSQLCVPTLNDPEYVYEGWRTTDNDTVNPPTYWEFYLYNITNHPDMIQNGSKPVLQLCGPYVYKYREEKFNISYSDDWKEVSYEVSTEFTFQPEMSNGTEGDLVWSINPAFVGGVMAFYGMKGTGLSETQMAGCHFFGETGPQQACLFGQRNVTEMIWWQFNMDIVLSNQAYFSARPINPYFGLFTKCENPSDCHYKNSYEANFGLGGKCNLVHPNNEPENSTIFLNQTYCEDPIVAGVQDNLKWYVATGQSGTIDDWWKIRKWMGNDSIWFWNTTYDPITGKPNRVEPITNTNVMYQFKRFLDKSDVLQIFDDSALQIIYMEYVTDHKMYDIELWRFRTSDALYAGNDPFYFGNGTRGIHNVSAPALIVHGTVAPFFVSRIFMAGADPKYLDMFECTNCPPVPPNMSNAYYDFAYGSWLDVNPDLGKVLRGSKSTQFNVELGQDYLYKNGNMHYAKVPACFLPVLTMNMTVSFNDTQANIVHDGLDSLHFGQNAQKGIRIGAWMTFGIFVVLAICCRFKWRSLMREQQQQPQPQHNAAVATADYTYDTYGGKGSLQTDTSYKRMG